MYLIEIIPITNLPKEVDQILFYYYNKRLQKSSLVSIKLNNANILGLVVSSQNLISNKNLIKKSNFKLKKITKVIINKNILNQNFFNFINFFSLYYNCNLSKSTKLILPNNLKSLTNFLLKETPTPNTKIINKKRTEDFFINKILPYLFNNISNKKQTLILCPTTDHANYIENILKNNLQNIYNINKQSSLNKT
jgi:primosomal protein N'